ncbi:hypothetical protein Y1Q_0001748 [Alligator mississippiensis]|uniref:DDE Tnp4 domain-containing protein n=1 Tax=Alligator mississippiensis TaxID=8496 RepID=A0A151P568_ALLMI|nr:hypothetical protein Y1Q_0001748 [Alligator mississippiensis]
MSAGTFRALCAEPAPALHRQHTLMSLPLSMEKHMAIMLWKLATATCYRAVGIQFGVGRSTAGAVVLEVCQAVQRGLLRRAVAWLGDAHKLLAAFRVLGLPRYIGALGLAHTPIQCPPHQAADYINARGYYSMALQVLVDHHGRFTQVSAGWPGKAHPARVLRRSGLYHLCRRGSCNDFAVDNLPRLVSACCALHNLCEHRGESFDEAWAAKAQRLGASFQQPEAWPETPAKPISTLQSEHPTGTAVPLLALWHCPAAACVPAWGFYLLPAPRAQGFGPTRPRTE